MVNRFSKYLNGNELKALWQDHIKEYWITSPTDDIDLKLDIVGEETLTAENDVTDHFVESNIAYQDQIASKPKIYTINGEVGELVWYQKDTISQKVGQVAQRLEGVISFLPTRSRGFQQMKKNVMKVAQWVDVGSNVFDRFGDLTPDMTKQEQAYKWLLFWRDVRLPLTVKSPWGTLENYVVTSLRLTQPKETKDKSYISITFKELRLTSVTTVAFDADKYQSIAGLENQPEVDNGRADGEDVSPSTTDDDGNKVCSVNLEDGTKVDAVYNYEDKKLILKDAKTKQTLNPFTLDYEEGIIKFFQECEDSVADLDIHGWGFDK